MDVITSAKHPQLKLIRKLQRRRARQVERAFVAEGEDLIEAALATNARPRLILVDASRDLAPVVDRVSCPILHVDPKALHDGVSELAHPPRVIGIFDLPLERAFSEIHAARAKHDAPWLLLDALADPGNVGTIVRTAAAFGSGGVALRPGTADIWSPKAVRASMGSCFRIPAPILDDLSQLDPLQLVVLDGQGDSELADISIDANSVIVIGNERSGVSSELLERAAHHVRIPQDPDVESINAGSAAAIALYEWRRSVR